MSWNRHHFFLIVLAFIGTFGIYLRMQDIVSRGLDYDEIWTWTSYSNKSIAVIFSDLHFPNNHPLHSLATKISTVLLGNSHFTLRLPALLAGLCIPLVAGFLAWRLMRDKIAVLLVFSICAFNGGLTYYSHNARGYTMQTLFVLIAGFSLFAMRDSKTERRFAPVIFLVSALATILTISTGVIFISALCLVWLLYNVEWRSMRKWIEGEWPFILSFLTFCIVCLVWYGLHYADLKSSRETFGEDLYSPPAFFSFAWNMILYVSGILWILVFIPLFSKEPRCNASFCALFLILVLLSALITKCVYPRVYLPLIPFIALGAAAGLKTLFCLLPQKYGKMKSVLCGALIVMLAATALPDLSKWTGLDWGAVAPKISKVFPKDVFINYLPTVSYPIWFNSRHIVIPDNFERISMFSGLFAQVGAPGAIVGQDTVTEGNITLSVDPACRRDKAIIESVDVEIFHFRPITQEDLMKGRIVLSIIGPVKDKDAYDRLIYSFFKPYKWLLLNSCLRANTQHFKEGLPVVDAFVTDSCDAPASGLLELEKLSNGIVRFFIIEN